MYIPRDPDEDWSNGAGEDWPDDPDNDRPESEDDGWSPLAGLGRGAIYGAIAAAVLAVGLGAVAKWVPLLLMMGYLRVVLGFVVTWIVAAAVQRGAGMVGWLCTGITVMYAALVVVSSHGAMAVFGVPTTQGVVAGWVWLQPEVLLVTNYLTLIGIGFAAALCHRGSDIFQTVGDILMTNPLTGRR